MRLLYFLLCITIANLIFAGEKRQIASFHPVVTDITINIVKDKWEVIPILKKGQDPHSFSPTTDDLKKVSNSALILLAGKGLENYKKYIFTSASDNAQVFEVGKMLPSVVISESNSLFICCPTHSKGSIDPHWWHSIKNVQKAARIITKKISEMDPENKEFYKQNLDSYHKQLKELYKWSKNKLKLIKYSNRKLSTSHASFAYFCREFSFKALPIQGLNREHDPNPAYLTEVIDTIRKENIKAVFPEAEANPKVLTTMIKETGINTGPPLLSSGPSEDHPTFIKMMKYNINSITEALK